MKSIDLIELDKTTTVKFYFDKNYQYLISNNFVLDSQLSQKWNDTNIYVNNKNGSCFVGTFGSHGGVLINSIENIETVLFGTELLIYVNHLSKHQQNFCFWIYSVVNQAISPPSKLG
jgi:hypothetical protein